MLAHLLAALLAQAAVDLEVAVVVTQRSGVTPERAELLATKVSDALSSRGVAVTFGPKASVAALNAAGAKNPTDCQGKRPCISGLGRLLRTWGVIAVEVADLDGTLAIHAELVDSDRGERHAEVDLVMQARRAEVELPLQIVPMVSRVRDALAVAALPGAPAPQAAPAPAPAPAPVKAAAAEPAPVEAVIEPAQPARGSTAPMLVAFAGGAVAAAASVVFFVLATQARSEHAVAGFGVTRDESRAIAARANTGYSFALGFAIGAGALVLLGAILGATR
ncbi:MAG: hypothetical protein JNK82_26080 [Myxococcaceae bacterium]|nr:hypothetical protein [Myxococcaceae bacterium]